MLLYFPDVKADFGLIFHIGFALIWLLFELQIVQIGDIHGIRFPREFGLLLKQLLYFDRYTQLLAPSLSVLNDDRVKIRQSPSVQKQESDYDITIN